MDSKGVIIAYKKGYRVLECGSLINHKGDKIKLIKHNTGYYRFCIRQNSKHMSVFVHRLHAFQKYGDFLFEKGIEVRHLNGNPLDNSYENIAIGTHSQNMMDIPESIRYAKALHATSFVRRHDAKKIKEFYLENGESYNKTMKQFNISSKGTLHYILNNRIEVPTNNQKK